MCTSVRIIRDSYWWIRLFTHYAQPDRHTHKYTVPARTHTLTHRTLYSLCCFFFLYFFFIIFTNGTLKYARLDFFFWKFSCLSEWMCLYVYMSICLFYFKYIQLHWIFIFNLWSVRRMTRARKHTTKWYTKQQKSKQYEIEIIKKFQINLKSKSFRFCLFFFYVLENSNRFFSGNSVEERETKQHFIIENDYKLFVCIK